MIRQMLDLSVYSPEELAQLKSLIARSRRASASEELSAQAAPGQPIPKDLEPVDEPRPVPVPPADVVPAERTRAATIGAFLHSALTTGGK